MENAFLSDDLAVIEKAIWNLLDEAVHSYRAPFHQGVFATIQDENPEIRMVVLRTVHASERVLFFHTDNRSPKILQLQVNQHVSWLFYDASIRMQLRCYGRANIHLNDSFTERGWMNSRLSSRLCYTNVAAPGTRLDKPVAVDLNRKEVADDELAEARSHFAVISTVIDRVDWLYLHHQGHRRAAFNYQTNEFQWKQV